MRIRIVEIEGEEADDIIATLAVQSAKSEVDVWIASTDKDFMQIVSPRIRLIRSSGKDAALMDAAAVKNRFGVRPEQMVDFLSLAGDSVDNIRGVPGVGEKTAAELLRKYGSVENILASVFEIEKPKLRQAILAAGDLLHLNRRLIALRTDLSVPVTLDDLKLPAPDYVALAALFKQFGFKSLLADAQQQGTQDLFAWQAP